MNSGDFYWNKKLSSDSLTFSQAKVFTTFIDDQTIRDLDKV